MGTETTEERRGPDGGEGVLGLPSPGVAGRGLGSPALPALLLLTLLALRPAGAAVSAVSEGSAPPSPAAVALRNLGLAQLENEQPEKAAESFRKLLPLIPTDPLPYADLAVAALRRQQGDEARKWIGEALKRAPKRADLLSIQGSIAQWGGEDAEALALYRAAAAGAPSRIDFQYALLRQAQTVGGADGDAALATALEALARLRPDNLVVVLQGGQRAIAAGDRTAATRAFLRVREIADGAGPQLSAALAPVLAALDRGDVQGARVPAARLENVLRPSAPYQQGIRELSPGIQGLPVERLASEPPLASFGDGIDVAFTGVGLSQAGTVGQALVAGDFDGDGRDDLARVRAGSAGAVPHVEILLAAAGWGPKAGPQAAGIERLLAVDLDNDGRLDLVGVGAGRLAFFKGAGDGSLTDASALLGAGGGGAQAAAALDFDLEGDLDLAVFGGTAGGKAGAKAGGGALLRNNLQGALEALGEGSLPMVALGGVNAVDATDLDRDGDPDLVIAHAGGLAVLTNLRQGRFADGTAAFGLKGARPALSLAAADFDNDGRPDLAVGGPGLGIWRNVGGNGGAAGSAAASEKLVPWTVQGLPAAGRYEGLAAADFDNDGRLDLAAVGPDGLFVLAQRGPREGPTFRPLALKGVPKGETALAVADLDGDGDLDLALGGPSGAGGLMRLQNGGGNKNHWLSVRLKGIAQGNGKNNLAGVGAVLEVRAGSAYQFREGDGGATHFGLGRQTQADALRILWTNGVPQNRLQPKGDQTIVEEQVLKGSCPFLYAWDGRRMAFVTDLLWNAPVGLPGAPGFYIPADPQELVRVDGLAADGGVYRVSITEELWEAAFFDQVRLWVVDHPEGVEVASSLRVLPGAAVPLKVLASRGVHPVTAAWDGAGEEATERVAKRDEVYASGFEPSPYQGVSKPWTFTFDLGDAPASAVRLLLEGWIFPADASLNLGVAQRSDYPNRAPSLEVETADGWQPLMPNMGFPAGKTKTMVIDTPPLPPGARKLRIVTSYWLAWDRIAWTELPNETVSGAEAEPGAEIIGRFDPSQAELRYRGFSALVRRAPNAPHAYDYERSTEESPWLPFPGRYSRYGDVKELLLAADDRSVILAAGDEIRIEFEAKDLPPVRKGYVRTLFLESHGWDKDADRNTFEPEQMEPLPFRTMKRYGDPFPETEALRRYREEWLTRVVP